MYIVQSVCLCICNTTTFESLDVGSSFSHMRYIYTGYGSSSYMKVIGSRSRSQQQKSANFPIHIMKKVQSTITPVLQKIEP